MSIQYYLKSDWIVCLLLYIYLLHFLLCKHRLVQICLYSLEKFGFLIHLQNIQYYCRSLWLKYYRHKILEFVYFLQIQLFESFLYTILEYFQIVCRMVEIRYYIHISYLNQILIITIYAYFCCGIILFYEFISVFPPVCETVIYMSYSSLNLYLYGYPS